MGEKALSKLPTQVHRSFEATLGGYITALLFSYVTKGPGLELRKELPVIFT